MSISLGSSAESVPEIFDVLIVGCGPVGATLAALLGNHGVQTLVIEKVKDIWMAPRAIALDNEALRILQMIGLDDQSFEQIIIPEVNMLCPYVGQFGRINTSGFIDGHPKLINFYQPELEKTLRDKVSQLESVTVKYELELVDLQQNENDVTVSVKDTTGTVESFKTRYLVGADGANSTVRELIQQTLKGSTYPEDWLVVDAINRPLQGTANVTFICNPDRPLPNMPAPGNRERWEFKLRAGETKEEMEKPEKAAELLQPWNTKGDLIIERQAVYRFHARCCKQFQKGKVFLVGDAAHLTPPFVGQGLVAGLRDVANIAWKLAAVTQGRVSPSILKSYDAERRPHAKKMINLARMMGGLVMPSNKLMAIIIHGAVRIVRFIPPLRVYFEELGVKPKNQFAEGLFLKNTYKEKANEQKPGRNKLVCGGQLPQEWVKKDGQACLSDDALGDALTLVGFGVNPYELLDESARARWASCGGQYMEFGMGSKTDSSQVPFVEILNNRLAFYPPTGWVAAIRPDKVVMAQSSPGQIKSLVSDCIELLS